MGENVVLEEDQKEFYNREGYLVLESFSSEDEINSLRSRMDELLDAFVGANADSSIFSKKAFGDDGKLKQAKNLCINKVGHALHKCDPVFKSFSCSDKFTTLLRSLDYKSPVIVQSMYIFKQPGIGGEVVPHQDRSYLYTHPPSCIGFWLALEDATLTNGCLWAIPKSHNNGLVRRYIKDDGGVYYDKPSPSYDQNDFVPIPVKAGSLVVIHGNLIHQSFENTSPTSRHAYSWHVVDTHGCKWAEDNWMGKLVDPEPLYVSSDLLPTM